MDSVLENDKKIGIDSTTFLLLYQHYKEYLVPVIVMFTSIILFIFIVIPQINSYFSIRDQEKIETEKLKNLETSLSFLKNLDEAALNENISSLSLTLPQNKDFAGILNSISTTSIKSGVAVNDFHISVGDINKTSDASLFSSLNVTLNLTGGYTSIFNYINELYKTSPLSEVTDFKINLNSSQITVSYFYKPYSGAAINEDAPLVPITKDEASLLSTVASWTNSASFIQPGSSLGLNNPSGASGSAVGLNPNPF